MHPELSPTSNIALYYASVDCSRFFARRVIKAWNSLPQSTNFS